MINEFVYDDSSTDDREYVELYNAGGSAVDISGWGLAHTNLDEGSASPTAIIPGGTSLAAGDYYVIGVTGVPNLDLDLGALSDIWFNNYSIFELKNGANAVVDAVAYEPIGFSLSRWTG